MKISGTCHWVSQPASVSLSLKVNPKSRYQFMRLCGWAWNRMKEEGRTVTGVRLELHQVDKQEDEKK